VYDLSPLRGCVQPSLLVLLSCDSITDVTPLHTCTALDNANLNSSKGLRAERVQAFKVALDDDDADEKAWLHKTSWSAS
jgi:hypothetical protein